MAEKEEKTKEAKTRGDPIVFLNEDESDKKKKKK
jgi:hypothetical protein